MLNRTLKTVGIRLEEEAQLREIESPDRAEVVSSEGCRAPDLDRDGTS